MRHNAAGTVGRCRKKEHVSLSRLLGPLTLMAAAALASGAAGFVYAHEPQRDEVLVTLERPPIDPVRTVGGRVVEVGAGRLVVEGEGGRSEFLLEAGTTVEELQPAAAGAFGPGMRVNIGAERSDYGTALTGIVAVGER